ncbi:MAG: DUF5697 family protein [Oscillospiraceae bacterium]|nr:DUF5697 family protein [Oscillospiraceae bacterium]
MYIVTTEQERLFAVIDKTGYLTTAQAERILPCTYPDKHSAFTERVLRQLQFQQKIRFMTDSVVKLPHLLEREPDFEMLAAIDIMLDIADGAPLELSAKKPPFKLCFLVERGDKVGSYGVVLAPPGDETQINFQLHGAEHLTVIFVLTEPEQRERYKTALSHYFAVRDGGKYRYFKGEN